MQFLDESRGTDSKSQIYTSTLTIAEIPPSRLKTGGRFGSFTSFLRDYRDAITQIAPDPNIMENAAHLHGMRYTKIGGKRRLETPDAIHLATALALQSVYGVQLDAFHTFDNGSQRGINGRAVPLLSYETWCEQCESDPLVREVIALNRVRPNPSEPTARSGGSDPITAEKSKAPSGPDNPEQYRRFLDLAREVGADQPRRDFNRVLDKVAERDETAGKHRHAAQQKTVAHEITPAQRKEIGREMAVAYPPKPRTRETVQSELAQAEEELAAQKERWSNYMENNPNKYQSQIRRAREAVRALKAELRQIQ